MPATDIKLMFELVKYSGVARAWRLGGKEVEWRFRSWDSYQNVRVGVRLQAPKARSCDCRRQELSPSRLGGLGERRKLPRRDLGRSPRNRRDFEHFMPNGVHQRLLLMSYFLKIKSKK